MAKTKAEDEAKSIAAEKAGKAHWPSLSNIELLDEEKIASVR